MTGNNNGYKTIWKNGSKKYNEKYICYFFTIWNLTSTITCKYEREVVFLTSVYFAISKLILFHFLFMYHALYFPTFVFTLYVPCFPFILIDHNQKQVLLIKWFIFLEAQKNNFLALFILLKMAIFTMFFWRWSTLWNSTWKKTALFRRCLTLLISKFK